MGKTSIEWTDASWNPIVGCTEVSPGCANCYAARLAAMRLKTTPAYAGLADTHCVDISEPYKSRWTGEVRFLPERLEEPLHWRKPRRIFVCDMGDLFHESVTDDQLVSIFSVMHRCPQHTFQILTKRPARMKEWFARFPNGSYENLWLGVSVENQHFADERIPLLLATPAAVRWISAEPLLGPLYPWGEWLYRLPRRDSKVDWVVCGGESGPNARPMHPDWARGLRDQCQAAGVPFFFKQWGEYLPVSQDSPHLPPKATDTVTPRKLDRESMAYKIGKHKAGRLLDGREWNEFPQMKP